MSDFLNAKTTTGDGDMGDAEMVEIHDEFSDEDNESAPLTSNMNE